MRDAVAHVLVHLAAAYVHIERVVPALAKASDASGVERNLPGGQYPDRVYAFDGALRIGIECSQAVDLVVVEVDPERQFGAHGEDVHQRTAHGVLAAFGHGADIAVSGALKPGALGVDGETAAGFDHQRLRFHEGCGGQPLHQRLHRCHQHAALCSRQGVQRREPFRDDVLVRREVVVGQRFPVGKGERFGAAGGEEPDFPPHAFRVFRVARDVQHEAVGSGDEPRDRQARAAAEQALPVVCRTRRGNVDVRRVHGEIRERRSPLFYPLRVVSQTGNGRSAQGGRSGRQRRSAARLEAAPAKS